MLLATCTTLGLLFATHFRFYYRIDWTLALWWGLKNWYLWGLFAPGVVWLARRVPPGRVGWSRTVAVHLAGAVALALLHPTLAIALSALAEGLDGATFFEAVRSLFLKRYALSFVTYGALASVAHAVDDAREPGGGEAPGVRRAEDLRVATAGSGAARPAERLLVRKSDRERFLPVDRIDRIEAEGNYVRIHAGREVYFERRTLQSLERQLDPARFLRVHRSHIVHVDRIERIEPRFKGGYRVVLRDGTRLGLSRTYRKRLEERVGRSF